MKQTETERFRQLLQDFGTGVLITHGQQTHFHSRPMAIARVDDQCDLWFITADQSAKLQEIDIDPRAHVVCQDGWKSCVSISGRASISRDRAKIRELWKSAYQVWFPQGPEDPNIALIHVAGEHGEYWDNTGLKRFSYVYQAIKAVVTGTTPTIKEGEQHGHVDLAHGAVKS